MQHASFDVLIIGGGINGCGIAVDAAGRGLSVLLAEKADLANGTSWKSSKLIHGGLRYLEHYEFKLVKKALAEREILLKKAPHLIHPLQFVLPHNAALRPAWLIRLGLFLYDHLSKHSLPHARQIKLTMHSAGQPLKSTYHKAFTYADCYVDDARLVILNALQAQEKGAKILPRTAVIAAERHADHWRVTLQDTRNQSTQTVQAKLLINASGPWLPEMAQLIPAAPQHPMSLVKGSHIIVPKLYDGDYAYILQNEDKRIVFVIPFEQQFSLIGTTDVAFHGNLDQPEIDPAETAYLCTLVNQYFQKSIHPHDVVWSYAGVRPLKTKGTDLAAISRDYELELDTPAQQAPLLNIYGGKITTYRELAEDVLQKLAPLFPGLKPGWTAHVPLPGGDIPQADVARFSHALQQQYPWLPPAVLKHYIKNYGTRISLLLKNAARLADLGQHFGSTLYAAEVDYLQQYEWAQTVEDILWRRSKYGLHLDEAAIKKLQDYLAAYPSTCV